MRFKFMPTFRLVLTTSALIFCADVSIADPIEAGLFTQNHLRQCSSSTACIGGDPTIERQSEFDLGTTGLVTTHINVANVGALGATSAGYHGDSLTPALSTYAYTSGPQRFTLGSLGIQRYEFLSDSTLTISATLFYSQSGETEPFQENTRGIVEGTLMAFQMDGDILDPDNCNIFSIFSALHAPNAAGFLSTCLQFNGQMFGPFEVEFVGLQNYQDVDFNTSLAPVSNGISTKQLTVTGMEGDVFYLAANLGVFAHLAGFGDARNALFVEIDQPDAVQPTFPGETFTPAAAANVAIDIKPGSDPNCFNINGIGVVPVAILGSDEIDVLNIEPISLEFGGLTVAARDKKGPMCHAQYSNADEFLDLVCQFEDDAENWSPESNDEASVSGNLIDGRPIEGTDSICVVP